MEKAKETSKVQEHSCENGGMTNQDKSAYLRWIRLAIAVGELHYVCQLKCYSRLTAPKLNLNVNLEHVAGWQAG
jgi:hypothetical protein